MQATVHQIQVADDPEAGSALALLLSLAGYAVETDFYDGTVFISADAVEPEVSLDSEMPDSLLRQLRERLREPAEEVELAELRSEFRNPAA